MALRELTDKDHLLLNISKTKEMAADFQNSDPSLQPVNTWEKSTEIVPSCAPGQWTELECRLPEGTELVLFEVRSFSQACSKMLLYQSVVVVLFCIQLEQQQVRSEHKEQDKVAKKTGTVIDRQSLEWL